MIPRRILLVVLALAACGERRDAPAREANAAGAAPAEDAAPAPAPPFRPLDAARLDELAALEVPGFTAASRDRSATSLVVALRGTGTPLRALVTVSPCLTCTPPDLPAWQSRVPELRALLPGGLEDDPATTFELAAIDLAGRRCIATYELGAVAYGDELEATHGARIYCNDGTTELVVRVDDDALLSAPTPEAARQAADRATVDEPARRLALAYLSAL